MPMLAENEKSIERWFVDNRLTKPDDFTSRVEIYLRLIEEWSKRINLISKNDLKHVLDRHVLDSLTPLKLIPEIGRLLDIGSGAGFPGIPIGLCLPKLDITLLESRHKKVLFLREACKRLGLRGVTVLEARIEDFTPGSPFDIVTMRALPHWESYLKIIDRSLNPDGKIIYYRKAGMAEVIDRGKIRFT